MYLQTLKIFAIPELFAKNSLIVSNLIKTFIYTYTINFSVFMNIYILCKSEDPVSTRWEKFSGMARFPTQLLKVCKSKEIEKMNKGRVL